MDGTCASGSPSPVPSKGGGEEHHFNPPRPSLPSINNQRIPGPRCDGNGESSLATDNVKGTFLQVWHPDPTRGAQQPNDPSVHVLPFISNGHLHAQLTSFDVHSEAPTADYTSSPNTRGRRPRKHKPNPTGCSYHGVPPTAREILLSDLEDQEQPRSPSYDPGSYKHNARPSPPGQREGTSDPSPTLNLTNERLDLEHKRSQ
ncbi:hypothetical protein FXO37_00293 [Capsicum annuum]|nr:hypothetical protein FXO37_00293 [Capsicum annuum]